MSDTTGAPKLETTNPTGAEVADFLRRHPDFLVEHPDLLRLLTPALHERKDGAVDLQRYMLDRARGDLAKLQAAHNDLVTTSRSNLTGQSRIHAGVLAMLEARTLEHLIEIIITDLAMHLDVDSVALGFEALDRATSDAGARGLKLLPKGKVDKLLGGRDVVLKADEPGDVAIFGGAATLVRSQALLRLQLKRDAPHGILAFGSRVPDKFHSGQGTELLGFLARTVELTMRGWLDR
jgi:uncharacterized protein